MGWGSTMHVCILGAFSVVRSCICDIRSFSRSNSPSKYSWLISFILPSSCSFFLSSFFLHPSLGCWTPGAFNHCPSIVYTFAVCEVSVNVHVRLPPIFPLPSALIIHVICHPSLLRMYTSLFSIVFLSFAMHDTCIIDIRPIAWRVQRATDITKRHQTTSLHLLHPWDIHRFILFFLSVFLSTAAAQQQYHINHPLCLLRLLLPSSSPRLPPQCCPHARSKNKY